MDDAASVAASADPRRLHADIIKTSNKDRSLLNTLITLYSNSNLFSDALAVFRRIPSPNVVSWTALISGQSNSPISLSYFIAMLRHPTLPNQRTLATLLKTCTSLSLLSFGLQLHALSIRLALSSEPFCGSALVSFYSKSKHSDQALKAFDEMPKRDEVCYAALVVGLAQTSHSLEALRLFARTRSDDVRSTLHSVSGALRAAAELAALEQCRIIHAHGVVTGHDRNVILRTGLVDGYGKCGIVSDARKVFDEQLLAMNTIGWNALMACYAQQGDVFSVLEQFNSMVFFQGFVPDEYSFLAILTSLCNSGLAAETESWLTRMRVEYGLEPLLEHYTCLISVLARVGRLDDAERIALNMPFEPDAGVWRALLSASANQGAADVARRMSKRLLELKPDDDSAYVIAANVFVSLGRWNEAVEVRKMMRDGKIRKEGGRSWIEVRGEVHVFLAGDWRHERSEEIYTKLEELMQEIGNLGYVPNWDNRFAAAEETEKKDRLWYHSEKLALAFGVLSGASPPGKALRIVKNLRTCKDCHEAFKYFSMVLEREIILRDVNRYHRFIKGSCNCRDYWLETLVVGSFVQPATKAGKGIFDYLKHKYDYAKNLHKTYDKLQEEERVLISRELNVNGKIDEKKATMKLKNECVTWCERVTAKKEEVGLVKVRYVKEKSSSCGFFHLFRRSKLSEDMLKMTQSVVSLKDEVNPGNNILVHRETVPVQKRSANEMGDVPSVAEHVNQLLKLIKDQKLQNWNIWNAWSRKNNNHEKFE
ncbi:hypothetical protein Dimus_028530 [Dionaea muscipula]